MKIQKDDITLRLLQPADAGRLAELANNEKVSRNLRDGFPHPYTKQNAIDFIEMCLSGKLQTVFAIEYISEYVGNISIHQEKDVYRKSAEIGYFIGEPYWNKGIATQAVQLICEWAFANLDIVRIHTGVFEFNPASCRVLEKCGFKKEGVFEKSVFKMAQLWDEIRYARLKE
ncbi:MAG: GNAT family N-acetyltransferase [Bacteroidales bacterium]|nr:GNAT family N-acetyltransferase [Bacteroidales bacterium]MCF8455328.1 GNAT family N-acetyltransferase [Bacteroidales bacterium]